MSGKPRMSKKEKRKKKKLLIELFSKNPIIETACQKVGINRMMFYRWKKADSGFSQDVDEVLGISRDVVNDLAESKVINMINDGHFGASKFWLQNNCSRYKKKNKEEKEKTGGEVKMFNVIVGPQGDDDPEEDLSQPALKEN